jgi:hypothetical protein
VGAIGLHWCREVKHVLVVRLWCVGEE